MFAALELRSIQADIQHYVLPRELTDQQIKSIHDYLVAHPQPNDAALTIMFAYQDSEASHSADQFFQAIRGTGSDVVEGRGWTVQMQGLTDTEMIAKGIYEGVQLQQRWPCTLNNGNVKSAALLQEALEKAHLQFGGGGSCENSRTDNQ